MKCMHATVLYFGSLTNKITATPLPFSTYSFSPLARCTVVQKSILWYKLKPSGEILSFKFGPVEEIIDVSKKQAWIINLWNFCMVTDSSGADNRHVHELFTNLIKRIAADMQIEETEEHLHNTYINTTFFRSGHSADIILSAMVSYPCKLQKGNRNLTQTCRLYIKR